MGVELVAAGTLCSFLGTVLCVLGALTQDGGAGDRLGLFDADTVLDACVDERARNVFLAQAGAVDSASTVYCRQYPSGFRVQGLGFGVWGLGLKVQGLGFGVWGLAFRV